MTTFFKSATHKVWSFALAHKFIAGIAAIVVLYGGYAAYGALTSTAGETSYVTATAATSTVVETLSESGQVTASQQISLSPKASGEVIGVYVKPGDHVYAGQVIAQLDASDAAAALQSAKLSLAHQQLSYTQTTATSTLALNLLQAQNAVTNAQTALQKTHDTSYASLSAVYTDLNTVISDLDSVLHDSNVSGRTTQQNIDAFADIVSSRDTSIGIFKSSAQTSYDTAVAAYNNALLTYKATPLSATNDELTALADTTYQAASAAANAVKDAHDFFDRVNTDYTLYNLESSTALVNLIAKVNNDTTTVNADLSTALSTKSNIVSAEETLAVAENSLQAVEGGSNTLTVQSAQISLEQAQQAVTTAEETLANYTVVAPFSGTIASVGVQKYDQASSDTAVATLVTDQDNVDITVSEADAASLKVGQKATVTFDALPDVTIAGTVSSIDQVGTISSGVVSYSATITLDTSNASVKPGMSATADIITNTATGIVVPASAVKTAGTSNYVLVFSPALDTATETGNGIITDRTPTRVTVTTGITDDTNTIILSSLSGGEQVVTKTATVSSTKTTSSTGTTRTGTFGGGGVGARIPGL